MWALIGGLIAVVVGIILLNVGQWGAWTGQFIAGGIVVLLLLGGLIAVASGISDLKDRVAEKKEEEEKEPEKKEEESKKSAT